MGFLKICVALLAVCVAGVAGQGAWKKGRGTFYGDQPWLWDIHYGSCGYDYLWPDIGTGWDIAALPDVFPTYSGSCGRCYEVKCDPTSFQDNYGNHLDRRWSCYDPNWSVVVTTTDTCPCNYATNLYSNKRWCCGDMDHFDLSVWTFEKLSERRWGVIGLQYREVPCDYKPENEAPPAKDPTPGVPPPSHAKRPSWAKTVVNQEADLSLSSGVQNGWWDKSYNVERKESKKTPTGGDATCAKIHPSGAISVGTYAGRFVGRVSMEAWIETQNGTPDLSVTVSGSQGSCASVSLNQMSASSQQDGFSKFPIYLGLFDKALQRVQSFASQFKGCSGNRANEVDTIEFRNDNSYPVELCIDDVKLL